MRWPRAQEFATTLLRTIVHGHVLGTSSSAQEAEPIAVDTDGVVYTRNRSVASLVTITSNSFNVNSNAVTVWDPSYVNVEEYDQIYFWVQNNTATNNLRQMDAEWSLALNGGGPLVLSGIQVIAVGNVNLFIINSRLDFFVSDGTYVPLVQPGRSVRVGFRLTAPAPAQNVTVSYVGVTGWNG